jgi:hypothetical protein
MAKRTYPYDIPTKKITVMQYVHSFLSELFKNLEYKVEILEGEGKKNLEKLIGLHYNMDDHKALVVETQKGFDVAQSKLKGFIEKVLQKTNLFAKTCLGYSYFDFHIVKLCI